MILSFIKKIPVIISLLAIVNASLVAIVNLKANFPLKEQLWLLLVRLQFSQNTRTIFYFNYWIIYIAIAIIISIILLFAKKYTPVMTSAVLVMNIAAGIWVMHIIIRKM